MARTWFYNCNKPKPMTRLADSKLIKTPVIQDTRGNLSFIENGINIPFEAKRIYYLFDVPSGAVRTGHAHQKCKHIIFALSGSFDVVLDDGFDNQRIQLNRAHNGLYLPEMMWRELDNFSSGTVCLVLASEHYDATDYIRSYDQFVHLNNPSGTLMV